MNNVIYFLILYLVFISRSTKCEISANIPDALLPCYQTNFTPTVSPPSTISVLVEIIRKIELNENYTMSTRNFLAALLHGIEIDGIQRSANVVPDDNLGVPYAATLNKFHKFKVIADYLVPDTTSQFLGEFLTLDELCFLHKIISNTVDRFSRGDEATTCHDNSLMPAQMTSKISSLSSCPSKLGNIKTKWATISASHLIAGIAAGLQQNEVTFQRVFAAIHEGHTNTTYMPLPDANDVKDEVDNVLFATIAGDLGEVVLSQARENPIIGNHGYWNDTMLPRTFYLVSENWDLTEAEILGGIDGAIIGKSVTTLTNKLESTKLSQLLEMYYSDRGIPYQFKFKVDDRLSSLEYLTNNINLGTQVYGATVLLRAIRADFPFTFIENSIKDLSLSNAEYFLKTARDILDNHNEFEYISDKELKANLEVIVILDNTFDPYETQQMLFELSESISLSQLGSRIGIINGQTGRWIRIVTTERFKIFRNFNQMIQQRNWPRILSLGQSLDTVISYYQNKTDFDCKSRAIKPMGKAIIVFSRDSRLTNNDGTRTERAIDTIKQSYPETAIIYVSPDINGNYKKLLRNNDFLINPQTNVPSAVMEITEKLSLIPASLIKFYCNQSDVRFEHYLTPEKENLFEVHRDYLKRGFVITKFQNWDYGDLYICSFCGTSATNRTCHFLTVNDEVSFNSRNLFNPSWPCDVQYSLRANNSRIKCAENDCRYPDQVLVRITYNYTSGSSGFISSFFLSVSLIYLNKILG